MRHRVKKIKIRKGKDANKMLLVKLAKNFLVKGKIVTTLKKAKVIKSYLERIIEKSKRKTEANKNYLLRFVHDKKLIDYLFNTIGLVFKDIKGGYVKVIKMGQRASDGSEMASLEWAHPITTK